MMARELIYSTISSIHGSYIVDELLTQYSDGRNCDLEIRLKDKCVYVHKCLLDIFMKEVGAELENDRFYLDLTQYEEQVIIPLVDMMYTGELRIQMSKVDQVCEAAVHVGYSQAEKGCHFYTSACPKTKDPVVPVSNAQPVVKQEPIDPHYTKSVSKTSKPVSITVNKPVSTTVSSNRNLAMRSNMRVITVPAAVAGRGAPSMVGNRPAHSLLKQTQLPGFLLPVNAMPAVSQVSSVTTSFGSVALPPRMPGVLGLNQVIRVLTPVSQGGAVTSNSCKLIQFAVPAQQLASSTTAKPTSNISGMNNSSGAYTSAGQSVVILQTAPNAANMKNPGDLARELIAKQKKQNKPGHSGSSMDPGTAANNNSKTPDKEHAKPMHNAQRKKDKVNESQKSKNITLKKCTVPLKKIPPTVTKTAAKKKSRRWRKNEENDEDYEGKCSGPESVEEENYESRGGRRSSRLKKRVNYNQIEETYKELDEDLSDSSSIDDSESLGNLNHDKDTPNGSCDKEEGSRVLRKRSASKDTLKDAASKCKRRAGSDTVTLSYQNVNSTNTSPHSQNSELIPNSAKDGIVTTATPVGNIMSKNSKGRPGGKTKFFLCHPTKPVIKPYSQSQTNITDTGKND